LRIILDTNIFIPLEDANTSLTKDLAKLNRLASSRHELLIHPASKEDISRDKDEQRKASMMLKISKYNSLESPPKFHDDEEEQIFGRPKKVNDSIDNLILLAILKNCVHLLISEDIGVLKKAKSNNLENRVLNIKEACNLLSQDHERLSSELVKIRDVPCHTLDINHEIFNSLRDGYPDFNDWYAGISQEGRKVWVCGSLKDIQAICIYKEETNEVVTQNRDVLVGRALKLCTFKVSKNGYKLGELLIKQAFDYADLNNINWLYLTLDESETHLYFLKELIIDFGFKHFGIDTKGRDSVFVKEFLQGNSISPQELKLPSLDFLIKYYPAINANNVNSYLVPVQPQFHNRLFPDICIQPSLFQDDEESVGNAIKQAYICKAQTRGISPGDIVFFYRSQDSMAITTYGVVEKYISNSPSEDIFNLVKSRTVYSIKDIQEMNLGLKAKTILFRRVRHLKNEVSLKSLKEQKIASGAPQSIVKLNSNQLELLINKAGINDCFLPD